jgi:hypothetical protein
MNLGIVGWVNRVQRDAVRNADKAQAALVEVFAKVKQAEAESGMELVPPLPVKPGQEEGPSSLFDAAFAAGRATRQASEAFNIAVVALQSELTERQERVAECRATLEAVEEERSQTLDAAQKHKQAVAQMVAREIAALDDKGESFQHGCACGLAFGCLALGAYIAFTVVMIFVGRQTSADSPIGVIFMTLFVAPIGISVLLQLVFSLKRMMVESELAAKKRQAEDLCEVLSEKAAGTFKSKQPALVKDLEEAEKEAGKIETALKGLTGVTEDAPAAEAPPPAGD